MTVEGDVTAETGREKAELMANTFVKVHRSNNLSEEGKRGRDTAKAEYGEVLSRETSLGGDENAPFTIGQIRGA